MFSVSPIKSKLVALKCAIRVRLKPYAVRRQSKLFTTNRHQNIQKQKTAFLLSVQSYFVSGKICFGWNYSLSPITNDDVTISRLCHHFQIFTIFFLLLSLESLFPQRFVIKKKFTRIIKYNPWINSNDYNQLYYVLLWRNWLGNQFHTIPSKVARSRIYLRGPQPRVEINDCLWYRELNICEPESDSYMRTPEKKNDG